MDRTLRLVATLAAIAWCVPQMGVAASPVGDPEAYGALPTVADVEISPNGAFLASIRNDTKGALVAFHDLRDRGAPATAVRLESVKPRSLTWANDDVLLVLVSQTIRRVTSTGRQAMEAWRWLAVTREDKKSRVILDYEPGYYVLSPGELLSTGQGASGRMVFSRWTSRRTAQDQSTIGSRIESKSTGRGISLFAYHLDTSKEELIAAGNADTAYWIVDAAGNAMFRVDRSVAGASIYARKEDGSGLALQNTVAGRDGDLPTLLGRSVSDGGVLALAAREGRTVLVGFDVEAGKMGGLVFDDGKYDVGGVL